MTVKRRFRLVPSTDGMYTLYTPDGVRDLSGASAAFLLDILILPPAEAAGLVRDLSRELGRTGIDVPAECSPANTSPPLIAPGRTELPPRLAARVGRLSSLAKKWHEANLRLRARYTGQQLDQRTIAKEADLPEHRHGTKYFREMEEADLGVYKFGRFHYHGEVWGIVDGRGQVPDAGETPVEQGALL